MKSVGETPLDNSHALSHFQKAMPSASRQALPVRGVQQLGDDDEDAMLIFLEILRTYGHS